MLGGVIVCVRGGIIACVRGGIIVCVRGGVIVCVRGGVIVCVRGVARPSRGEKFREIWASPESARRDDRPI